MTELSLNKQTASRSGQGLSKLNKIGNRLALPIIVTFFVSLAAIAIFVPRMVERNAEAEAIRIGQNIAEQFKVIRGYYTSNVIRKVVAEGSIQPAINHRDVDGTIPLPATFIHDVSALLSETDLTVDLYSAFPFAERRQRQLDDFQRQAWEYLSANPAGVFTLRDDRGDVPIVRVAVADKMSAQGCVDCHNSHPSSPKTDWKLGDVRGVLEVTSNITDALAGGAALSNKLLGGAAVIGALLIVAFLYSARHVVGPINKMTAAMAHLSAGDTSAEIPGLDRRDEFGQMATAVKYFKEGLDKASALEREQAIAREADAQRTAAIERRTKDFDAAVSKDLESVADAAQQLQSSSESMSMAAEETTDKAAAVAAASQQTSDNVQAVAATCEELRTSIDEISRQMSQSREVAENATMEIGRANDNVAGLAKSAQSIGEVVSLITDIAEKTNLLALNATIEAARAGDAGKGFAVVASEVKELANQTAKATDEIGSQIDETRAAIDETIQSIDRVGSVITELNGAASETADAVSEQQSAAQEIARRVVEAANGTTEVNHSIGDVTDSASQTRTASTQLSEVSNSLRDQAGSLRQQVNAYLDDIRSA